LILIRGRWGFFSNCWRSAEGLMREGVTPGKCCLKKGSTRVGFKERWENWPEGRKSVHVKE
jgi:hypothetical protein